MFTSQLEASKFAGASVRTVSGIRGTVKKPLRPGVHGGPDGSVRISFEDKPLLSDIVFLRAWVALDMPKLYNPMTNLLAAPLGNAAAAGVRRKGHVAAAEAVAAALPAPTAAAGEAEGTPAAAAAGGGGGGEGGEGFQPSAAWAGPRPGWYYSRGPQGLGYYRDAGPAGNAAAAAGGRRAAVAAAGGGGSEPAAAAGGGSSGLQQQQQGQQQPPVFGGWLNMRTVAELRREAGVGAPRQQDSLYRPVDRAPRVFNPLTVPRKLQAALPFKSKPKLVGLGDDWGV
jgi:ribosome biogenesis protein BMS1